MTPTHKTKDAESLKLRQDYKAWLEVGNKPEILPSPGDGHRLTATYSLRNHDAATAIKAANSAPRAEQ